MSKYEIAAAAIHQAVESGAEQGWDKAEMFLTVLVSAIQSYKEEAGSGEVVNALKYELSELKGEVDTAFLRSR